MTSLWVGQALANFPKTCLDKFCLTSVGDSKKKVLSFNGYRYKEVTWRAVDNSTPTPRKPTFKCFTFFYAVY